MTFEYVLLPIGILCLGIPGTVLTSEKVRDRMRQPARRYEFGMTSLARPVINWVDLARAALGAWIIQFVLPTNTSGENELVLTYSIAQVVIIGLGIMAQVVWIQRPVRIVGPLFYLAGLSLVLCDPAAAGLAVALSIGCALMLRRLRLAFVFAPFGLVVFGALFGHIGLMTIVVAFGYALPALLAFGIGSRIVFARRPPPARKPAPVEAEIPAENQGTEGVVITPDFAAERIKVVQRSLA